MNATVQIPIVSADAGDPIALSNPNSPASLAKKSREQESQSAADTKYDETPPERIAQGAVQGFINMNMNYSLCTQTQDELRISGAGTFLSLSILLLLYAVAPNPN